MLICLPLDELAAYSGQIATQSHLVSINMAGGQMYSLAAGEGDTKAAQSSDIVTATTDAYGAVKSVSLRSMPGVRFRPDYLVYEGLRLHAQTTPDQLCIRLPRTARSDSEKEVVDATLPYFDANYRIVALAVDKLMDELDSQLRGLGIAPGPGTTVAILSVPSLHATLHAMALWRMDCAVQWFNHELGHEVMDQLLAGPRGGDCVALLHAGLTAAELESLSIAQLRARTGVHAIAIPEHRYASALLEEVLTRDKTSQEKMEPRPPMSPTEFAESKRDDLVRIVLHTSGSSGTPKVIRWDLFGLGIYVRPPPQIQCSPDNVPYPYLQVSRPYWTTSTFLMTYGLACGTAMALCHPRNRLYPSTREALDLLALTQSKSVVFFPAQARELKGLVEKDAERYLPILRSLASIQFIGACIDSTSAEAIASLKLDDVVVLNLHGLGEIGTTSLATANPPFDGLYSTSGAALFEPLEDDGEDMDLQSPNGDSRERLVKLWISMDKHPLLWYQLSQGRAPSLKIGRFPVPGPMLDRPALDTGDIFKARPMPNGMTAYFHHARDDDVIRLSNLYRPNVLELEAKLMNALTTRDAAQSSAFLPYTDVDAVQIMGDGKPQLSVVIQLRSGIDCKGKEVVNAAKCAIGEVDSSLPESVRISILQRIAIVAPPETSSTAFDDDNVAADGMPLLLKTHKGNLRRRTNTQRWQRWLDTLPYS